MLNSSSLGISNTQFIDCSRGDESCNGKREFIIIMFKCAIVGCGYCLVIVAVVFVVVVIPSSFSPTNTCLFASLCKTPSNRHEKKKILALPLVLLSPTFFGLELVCFSSVSHVLVKPRDRRHPSRLPCAIPPGTKGWKRRKETYQVSCSC